MMQGKTEQHRKQQYLQDIAAGKGTDHAARNNIQQKGNNSLRLGLLRIGGDGAGIQRGRIDVHSSPRLQQIDHAQPDDEGDGADHLKVDQGNGAGLADRLHALHPGNTGHYSTKNNGGDNHLD